MRRVLALLLAGSLAGFALLAMTPSVNAAGPLTGRLVDSVAAGTPGVAGMTVKLRAIDGSGGAGVVVDEAVTGSTGQFSLNAGGSSADEFYVQVIPGTHQGGWVGGGSVQAGIGNATTHGPAASLGSIKTIPAYIRGVVVNSVTKRPVAGVRVTARSQDKIGEVDGDDWTDSDGAFRINGLTCEDDCYLKLNGSDRGYETGFRGCSGGVVATWGAACASPIGRIPRTLLDKL